LAALPPPAAPQPAAAMGGKRDGAYVPGAASADVYDDLYAEYVRLHDYFGRGANPVMHRLRALRDRALARDSAARDPAARGLTGRVPDAPRDEDSRS
jgi:L-ribulokinase